MQTYNGFQWTLGVWETASGNSDHALCSDSWLHCYDHPLIAVLHNPIHADIDNPRLFEVETAGDTKNDRGLKRGFKKMRLVREVLLPVITQEQYITYGILCAKSVCTESKFIAWANCWLSGKDRSQAAAEAAAEVALGTVAWAAARAAAGATAGATARAAAGAAWAAAGAAAGTAIDLIKLAEKAMGVTDYEQR